MLHLGPEAAYIPDSRGRLPLHVACRRSTGEKDDERALKTLILGYPKSVLHRDDGDRTPLYYLLWYHAASRSTRTVELFLSPHPPAAFCGMTQPSKALPVIPMPGNTNIPPTAAIVPDAKYGCLPSHYAIMEVASKDVVRLLLQAYPASKTAADRFGRLALHWYLGAGLYQHVSGEPPDPNVNILCNQSTTVVGLLLNSKSARSVDLDGRVPLHWAASLLALYAHANGADTSGSCCH